MKHLKTLLTSIALSAACIFSFTGTIYAAETEDPSVLTDIDDGLLIEGTTFDAEDDYITFLEPLEATDTNEDYNISTYRVSGIVDSNGQYNGYDVMSAKEAAEYCMDLIKDHKTAADKTFLVAVDYSVSELNGTSPYTYAFNAYNEAFTQAFNDSLFVDGKGGDYALYSMYGRPLYVTSSCKYFTDGDEGTALVYATPGKATYYTSDAEESEFRTKAKSVLSSLKLDGKNDYDKVCAIYDYICDNVTYDYEHLGQSNYYTMYTAYGALCNGTAVCQGYSNLFYYLCNEAGVPCRIVAGIGVTATGSGAHAWNIVKMENTWYHVDVTWGASYAQWYSGRYFFLQSTQNFTNGHNGTSHILDYMTGIQTIDYTSSEFTSVYPISKTADYCGNHDYKLVSRKAAACGEYGYEVYTCSKCGETYEETLPMLIHNYKVKSSTNATCTTAGRKTLECTYCGDVETEEIPATGHTYKTIEHQDAGCVQDGYDLLECTVCGHTHEENVVPSFGGHTYEVTDHQDVTHTEDGYTDYVCTVCGETARETFPAIPGCVYDDYTEIQFSETCGYDLKATCAICGKTIYVCSDLHEMSKTDETETKIYEQCSYCGLIREYAKNEDGTKGDLIDAYVATNWEYPDCGEDNHVEEEIEALDATCLNVGHDAFTRCSVCGKVLDGDPNFASLAEHQAETQIQLATCEENGYEDRVICAYCGEILDYGTLVSATGHSLVREAAVEATCEEDGMTEHIYCQTCGYEEETADVMPALGHDYIEKTTEATCTEDGYYSGIYCQRCGYQLSEGYMTEKAHGHVWVVVENEIPATCYTDGTTAVIACKRCGEIAQIAQTIPAGHKDVIHIEYKAPTEEEDGTIECWYCYDCNTFFYDEALTQEVAFEDTVLHVGDTVDENGHKVASKDQPDDDGDGTDGNNGTDGNTGTDTNSNDGDGRTGSDTDTGTSGETGTDSDNDGSASTTNTTSSETDTGDGTKDDTVYSDGAKTGEETPWAPIVAVSIAVLVAIAIGTMNRKRLG